ncbi:MAG: type II toxin-antitoxin system Phd/YefM family antitoxin [Bifidobacterium scardovii]|uniref:type II toxin-antitoxin system Phd/YefM family antitoxin n=1 Tax=Bifidobacterium scardovii TaxID=158787 RepID=UPI000A802369|nr:type II toxin-antitoxin system Phd/YefM family antitoxin [Bifidobacterium scardovii]MDU2420632.1 type II toxin-antitoxin system Phd/YefM family antitoxin [Bifidobacterium scardovii]MDU3736343.1 type II toxin-antitoxin system Phd/YefM family antitoxin [Bifidobacterium scardovii]MDU5296247.1 type II toxin-antitoxin system Phd/YefM family antitoxin [Bifidobacterium scardovii]MDU5610713.1 type II toxin-antitoxin system Phd/YefM family antitoxin [Bifidobacterium scardovii]MDU5885937.1 type II to
MIQEDHSAMQARHGASLHNRRHTVQYFVQDMPQWTESMMVQAVSYSAFRNNLKSYMRKVNEDADTLMVTNIDPNDNVVVMSVRDYDSLMEMLRIHQNPYLRDKIAQGLEQARQGSVLPHDLIDPED